LLLSRAISDVTATADAINLRIHEGALAIVASTPARLWARFEVHVFATQGMLYVELWRGTMEAIRMGEEWRGLPDLAPDEVYPHQAPERNLIETVMDPSCNRSPAELGVAAMEVIEAATDPLLNVVSHQFFMRTLASVETAWLRPRYAGYITLQRAGGLRILEQLRGNISAARALEQLDDLYRQSRNVAFNSAVQPVGGPYHV
jgi:hypothetical protein